jgi:hypothetical protein
LTGSWEACDRHFLVLWESDESEIEVKGGIKGITSSNHFNSISGAFSLAKVKVFGESIQLRVKVK